MARLALLCVAAVVCVPATVAHAGPGDSAHARKPKKKADKKKRDKHHRSHHKSSHHKHDKPAVEPEPDEISIVGVDPAQVDPPRQPGLGEIAVTTPVPEPPYIGNLTTSSRERGHRPTWFFGVRGGPSAIDRRGFYNFRSNRQLYQEERNGRVEVELGRYIGRSVSLGVAGGTGPYPKFDAPDPLYDENTRFSVYLFHSRLDLDMHASWFVIGLGAGVGYEHTTGSFEIQDPVTLQIESHTATFKRFAAIGAARMGIELPAGPFAFELLAEATVLKLFRGTYRYSMTTEGEGPSDREMGYSASLLLGVRLQ